MTSKKRGQIITFYSYKGGTGRTMALANVSYLLAQENTKRGVLMVDWDLEAPGLHRFCRGVCKQRYPDSQLLERTLNAQPGVIELFCDLNDSLPSAGTLSRDDLRAAFDKLNLGRFIFATDVPSLHLLKAGRLDERYSLRVNTFDWEAFYKRCPLIFRALADYMAEKYDYVLVDSRTGESDTSGICTTLMPEKLVVVFTPNHQSIDGAIEAVRRAVEYRRQSDDLRPLVVFPLVSRIEAAEPELRDMWRSGGSQEGIIGFQPLFENLFKQLYSLPECDLDTYFSEVQIQQLPKYAYGEELATLAERSEDRLSLGRSYRTFAHYLSTLRSPWERQERRNEFEPTESQAVKKRPPRTHDVAASEWQPRDGERVVLFDLDGTLIDSRHARVDAWNRALSELGAVLRCGPDVSLAAFDAIYRCASQIADRMGPAGHIFEDLRQEWNTRTSYSLLIAWSQGPGFPVGVTDPDAWDGVLARIIQEPNACASLLGRAEQIRDPWSIAYAPALDSAMVRFWEGDWSRYLYPGVLTLLSALRRNGVKYYVVTEGHLPTAWRKICATGLGGFDADNGRQWIGDEQLLVAGQAARPRSGINALNRLADWYRDRAATRLEVSGLVDAGPPRSMLIQVARSQELVAAGLVRIVRLFQRLTKKSYHSSSGEIHPDFYTRVIYAINQAPDSPRSALDRFDLSWSKDRKIRLAMVGDRFRNDVEPTLALARVGNTKVLSIWVRQGAAGRIKPYYRSESSEQLWLECHTIEEAGHYLLDPRAWLERTGCFDVPPRMFSGAIEPHPGTEESLESNLMEIVFGLAGARAEFDYQVGGPSQETVEGARTFVDQLLQTIIASVQAGSYRDQVVDYLLSLCVDETLRIGSGLSDFKGAPESVVGFLFAVATASNGQIEGTKLYPEPLASLAKLVSANASDWSAAIVKTVCTTPRVVDQIRSSPALRQAYLEILGRLLTSTSSLPPGFPLNQTHDLYAQLRASEFMLNAHTAPPTPNVTLGPSSGLSGLQQSVYLGKNTDGDEVRCNLGGPRAANVICVCGGPGTGKSAILQTLARGALLGESLAMRSAQRSSVIVFDAQSPSPFVELAQNARCQTEILAGVTRLEQVREEYSQFPGVAVGPLQFGLEALPVDAILGCLGPQTRAATTALGAILQEHRAAGIDQLIDLITRRLTLSHVQKARVCEVLNRLRPLLVEATGTRFTDHLEPGRLTMIDCGHNGDRKTQLTALDLTLSVLANPDSYTRLDQHFLLVLDDLYGIIGARRVPPTKTLVANLDLIARMGRHLQISVVVAADSASDLLPIGNFANNATLLLLRQEVSKTPDTPLWVLARRASPSIQGLGAGQAWYCSSADGHLRSGIVRIERAEVE